MDQLIDEGPVADSCCVSATPTMLEERGETVVMVNFGWIVTVSVVVAVCRGVELSTTTADTLNVPAAEGVPLTVPPFERLSPDDASAEPDHEYGAVPPVTANAVEYEVSTAPLGKELVVIDRGGGATVIVSALVVVCD
jgi:hypothetical protein